MHCKTLELPLNYHEKMNRLQFRTPSKRDETGCELGGPEWHEKCKRYLKHWVELIVMEKTRRMHFSAEMWPPDFERTHVANVYDMPIVPWLTKGKGQKRTAAPDDGQRNDRHRHSGSGVYEC